MFNKKEETASLLRQILAEQKKQTKILQAIESSKEHYEAIDYFAPLPNSETDL